MGHKCTAASALAIAQQIDPRWGYSHKMPPDGAMRCGPVTTTEHEVQTELGPKRIEARHQCGLLILRCPFTSEQFVFRMGAPLAVGHGLSNPLALTGASTTKKVLVVGGGLLAAAAAGLAIAGHVKHGSVGWYFHASAW